MFECCIRSVRVGWLQNQSARPAVMCKKTSRVSETHSIEPGVSLEVIITQFSFHSANPSLCKCLHNSLGIALFDKIKGLNSISNRLKKDSYKMCSSVASALSALDGSKIIVPGNVQRNPSKSSGHIWYPYRQAKIS